MWGRLQNEKLEREKNCQVETIIVLMVEVTVVLVVCCSSALKSYLQQEDIYHLVYINLSTHTTPWPHFIIDVGLVQRGYSIPSPVLLKCCVASVVA